MSELLVTPASPAFPERLKDVIDSDLWTKGNIGLLDRTAIGICGSRDASPSALKWAYHFGKEAAGFGIVVVSGYARGIDRQAHKGALEAGGATIAVIPEGIKRFHLVRDMKDHVDLERNFLAVSMFEPDASWTVWRAMRRNRLIVGLAVGLFVIEARETGGTINAAYECVRQKKHLWAVSYPNTIAGREGNERLIAGAAVPLKSTGDLRRALQQAMEEPPSEVRQLVLNLVGRVD